MASEVEKYLTIIKKNNNIPTNQANFLCQVEQKFHHQLQEYIQNIKIETILHRKKKSCNHIPTNQAQFLCQVELKFNHKYR